MSASAYATFASVFGLISFGHGMLALTNWRRGKRDGSLNYLIAAAVFFAGVASWCAVLG
ncbi:hypothetical protein [Streptomyces caniscabiei]|uniref:hypothetical protein n=1 Tax=Streptomyces caniscabiei TaxID=2746961 RepID=UPI001872FF03|nr:hypothetical protein [Streptomyces caniscabiei]MBE4761764.1 hypothetical protein [Streptomyces caniscabiei]MDX2948006.1 hypothetical protein [Streptomyces caniscabiei]MDX2986476.1 hypothetical protein [Streptomyces caniscabiei]